MQATLYKSANNATPFAFSHDLIEWVRSAAGQSAMNSAIEKSTLAANTLSESRKIQPEQLHVPITL